MWLFLSVLIVLIVAALPVLLELLRKPVGANDRGQTTGELVKLSQGHTHYRWVGPVRGPVAVFIHGLSTPAQGFEAFAKGLGDMGYRVLMYDLYGRGLSDSVAGRQDRAYFLRQLTDLLGALRLKEDITFVGYSMGGAIATAFAAENPHYVKRVILVAPAGVVMTESKFSQFCRKNVVIGDWVHGVFAARRMRKSIPRHADDAALTAVYDLQRQQLRQRGFLPALLSSRRGMLSEVQEQDHRKLRRLDVPTIAIWAENDVSIPIQGLGVLAQWRRDIRQEMVPEVGHDAPYTHCTQVLAAVVRAMKP